MLCFLDYRTSSTEKSALENLGFDICLIPKCDMLYAAIDGHVDIQISLIDKASRLVVINNDLPTTFKNYLLSNNIKYIDSSKKLLNKYPHNIGLNAYISDNYLIHNTRYTDPNILDSINNKNIINIKQGYSNCSILHIKEKVVITNDPGIYNILLGHDFDILLLPYGDIVLPDFDYGFIGGVGGMISPNTLALFGSLDHYIYGDEVKTFLKKHNVTPLYLYNGKLIDRGGLLIL